MLYQHTVYVPYQVVHVQLGRGIHQMSIVRVYDAGRQLFALFDGEGRRMRCFCCTGFPSQKLGSRDAAR
jgi:hypothetical protein